ncbi:MAG: tetratricopeptide repeat protein [Thermaceae bacterium]|nr:tetratricopeptide repeat protein [Thermaceae bacterium]
MLAPPLLCRIYSVKEAPLEEAKLSLFALLETGQLDVAANLLQTLLELAPTYQQVARLLDIFFECSSTALVQHPAFPYLYAQALCRARKPEKLLCFLEGITPSPQLGVYRAWALVRLGKPHAALDELETLPLEAELDFGLLWRTRGEAEFHLGETHWRASFERSQQYLSGVALGRSLLDEGGFLNTSGQRAAARVKWSEALTYLKNDPYYLAWTHNSLGYALLKDQPEQAERHLLEAVRISKQAAAQEFRCRALSGLGAIRRSMGELERARSSYQQAIKAPGDISDRQQALWGYAHTLRRMGQVEEAYARLLEAYQLDPQETWIQADIAAARLMLGDQPGARESLSRVATWGERSRILRSVLEAELLRQAGQTKTAKAHLKSLPLHNLWVQEELGCFPELRRYTTLGGQASAQKYRVEVNPYGPLEVWVNGRAVPLNSTGKPGELLVFLLLHGKAVNLERLIDRLCDDKLKNQRKALWEHIKALRLALGWQESVQSSSGIYRLDPRAEWTCLEEPLPLGSKEFMEGYYSDWILERRPLII